MGAFSTKPWFWKDKLGLLPIPKVTLLFIWPLNYDWRKSHLLNLLLDSTGSTAFARSCTSRWRPSVMASQDLNASVEWKTPFVRGRSGRRGPNSKTHAPTWMSGHCGVYFLAKAPFAVRSLVRSWASLLEMIRMWSICIWCIPLNEQIDSNIYCYAMCERNCVLFALSL